MSELVQQAWARNYGDTQGPATRRGLREWLRHGVLNVAGRFRAFDEADSLRCLYLHYVYDDQVEAFRDRLRRLQELGRFVTSDDVLQHLQGRKRLEGRCFHLSLDDGFDNVYRNAAPVLQELDIPAIFFLPSRLIGLPDDELRRRWWVHDVARPTRLIDWQQAREMLDAGFEIGSHTQYHARLSDVSADPKRLEQEVRGSKLDLEDKLGSACRFISWPFGSWRDVDDTALAAIEAAGYDGCFSAVRGRVEPGRTPAFTIPRHHFEPQWPWAHVRYFASGGKEGSAVGLPPRS